MLRKVLWLKQLFYILFRIVFGKNLTKNQNYNCNNYCAIKNSISWIKSVKNIVASDACKILTMLLPTKIVVIVSLKFSASFNALLAPGLSSSTKVLRRIKLILEYAVSLAEKDC